MPRLTIKQGILSPPPAELLRKSSNVDPDAALPQPEEIREKSDDRECSLPSIGEAQVRDENARVGQRLCRRQSGREAVLPHRQPASEVLHYSGNCEVFVACALRPEMAT